MELLRDTHEEEEMADEALGAPTSPLEAWSSFSKTGSVERTVAAVLAARGAALESRPRPRFAPKSAGLLFLLIRIASVSGLKGGLPLRPLLQL